MRTFSPPHRAPLTALTLILLSGCAVGPDFVRPKAPNPPTYDSIALPDQTTSSDTLGGAPQRFTSGQDIPSEWWTLFQSEALNRLILKAIKANPDLAAAQASLRVAQENAASGNNVLFPNVDGSFNTTRQKTSGASGGNQFGGSVYTLHNASVSVSYGLDIFGASRRYIEQLDAQTEYQRFQLEAAYLTLTANVVTTALQEASLRGQFEATQKLIESQSKARDILVSQFEAGAVAKAAVLAQEATLAQTTATLPPLEKQLSQTRHLLSVLTGDLPSNDPEGTFELSKINLPQDLPVSLPSQLVEQRPDVRAAEANLQAASAAIGVAEAKRLPQFMLSASTGSVANNLGKLFTPGGGIWSMGANLTETLFDAGEKLHIQRGKEAEYDVAAAQYRKTVLTAFQDVADSLHALHSDALELKAQNIADRAAEQSLTLTEEQYKAGAVGYINLLQAQQTAQQAKIALVQAQARRYADTAALFQALGGGWWNRKLDITKPLTEEVSTKMEFEQQPLLQPVVIRPLTDEKAPTLKPVIIRPLTDEKPASQNGDEQ